MLGHEVSRLVQSELDPWDLLKWLQRCSAAA